MGPVVDRIVADATTHALRFATLEVLKRSPTQHRRSRFASLATRCMTSRRFIATPRRPPRRRTLAATRLRGRVARKLGLAVDVAAADDALMALLAAP
ncbi:MAG: hypothetical protein IPN17_32275 [Deltaproteobacteria bacterium]|nr:hypothetical protein [Deltaproteobacteria bacterium]